MMNGIVPKNRTKGTDFCGTHLHQYIIRSDIGCYMQSTNFHKGADLNVYSLHPACQNGDHYIGVKDHFYIIKGDSYRRVTDLSKDTQPQVYSLHPHCQGGDFYFSAFDKFFIIFQEKGIFRITTDMTHNSGATELTVHPNLKNGLYYFGQQNRLCFIKPASKWGVEYYVGTHLNKDLCTGVYSIHPDVLNFMPGGLSVTKGPATGMWMIIKTIANDSETPVTWQKKVNKKVGYDKEKMSEITHNWKIAMSASIEAGALVKLITQFQFSFSAEYGGSRVNTEKESWNEMTEVEEQLTLELKPNQCLYLWQYKLGFGPEPVLFCRDLKIHNNPNPPTEIPLPHAEP